MKTKIKVRKSLGKGKPLVKIERNENVAAQIPEHAVITNPPHTPDKITEATGKVSQYYTQHLTGDKEATKNMYLWLDTLDGYYYDTAAYVEQVANATKDPSLPISMGFEVYAERKPQTKKGLTIRDGNHSGEVFVSYPKLEGAAAYRAELAEVIEGKDPVFQHAGACSITFMVLQNVKPDTKFLIRLNGIFSSGEGPTSEAVPFRTKEWS
jgi:hypothetical protein